MEFKNDATAFNGEKMDKDRFRRDLGNVMEACEEVLGRVRQTLS